MLPFCINLLRGGWRIGSSLLAYKSNLNFIKRYSFITTRVYDFCFYLHFVIRIV